MCRPSFYPRWRSRLGPLLEAWDKMSSSITDSSAAASGGRDSGRRGSRRLSGASASNGGAEGRQTPPVDAFVAMENESAVGLCEIVSASLGYVKKVKKNCTRTTERAGLLMLVLVLLNPKICISMSA